MVSKTDALITDNWKESTVRLPFDDLNEKVHPNVASIIISFISCCSLFFRPIISLRWIFQEYKKVLEKLKVAYYSNVSDVNSIIDANIALMTDLNFADTILKNVALQADANTRAADKNQHKNTFFVRWKWLHINQLRKLLTIHIFRFLFFVRFSIYDSVNPVRLIYNVDYKGTAHSEELCYMFQ